MWKQVWNSTSLYDFYRTGVTTSRCRFYEKNVKPDRFEFNQSEIPPVHVYNFLHGGKNQRTVDSLLRNKEALQCTVLVENLNVKQNIKKVVLDDAFLQSLQYTKQILHPVSKSINLVESDRSILSEVPFVVKYIKDIMLDIPQHVDLTSSLTESLLKCVKERYEFCSKPIHFAANLLDARFKGEQLNEDQLMEAVDFICEMARSLNLDVRKVVANIAQFRTETGFFC
ncbi:unnamed protein product [Acanthoscelides obtectus]|uniref:Uncharacterized protein n=1 Tax=Acanthoscelides obtectus TaxID=200917 RepID=A0A9P0PWN9_ACAOB|nr:unnamed protein product [Acanthoscelides obtectus]CAK1675378.1 hypothetical protein AOBTE_LOCUS30180 [Acanthoscelides obtectus]